MARQNLEDILPGCYYPDCDDSHAIGQKFCPRHYGTYSAHAIDGVIVERKGVK